MLTGTCSSGGTLVAALKWRRNIKYRCQAIRYLHRWRKTAIPLTGSEVKKQQLKRCCFFTLERTVL